MKFGGDRHKVQILNAIDHFENEIIQIKNMWSEAIIDSACHDGGHNFNVSVLINIDGHAIHLNFKCLTMSRSVSALLITPTTKPDNTLLEICDHYLSDDESYLDVLKLVIGGIHGGHLIKHFFLTDDDTLFKEYSGIRCRFRSTGWKNNGAIIFPDDISLMMWKINYDEAVRAKYV
jgi:hypothetical protein